MRRSLRPNYALLFLAVCVCVNQLTAQSSSGWERRVILDRNDYIPLCMVDDGRGGFLIGGQSRRVEDKHWYGMLMAVDADLQVRWALVNRSDTVGNIIRIRLLADGHFIALNNFWFGQGGSGWSQAGLSWIKFDRDGQILWHKSERTGVTALPTGVDLLENAQGEIITLGYHQLPLSVNKLSGQGDVLWNPFGSTSGFFQASAVAPASPDEFFILGSSSSSRHNNINRGLILKVRDNTSPTMVWSKNYLTDVDVNFQEIFPAGAGEWLVYGVVIPGSHLLAKINARGDVLWSKSYSPGIRGYQPQDAAINSHGEIVMMGGYKNHTLMMKVDRQGDLLWANTLNSEEGTMRTLLVNNAGEIIIAGAGFKYHVPSDQGFDFYLTKADGEGRFPACISRTQNIQIRTHSFNIIPPDFQATSSNYSFFQQQPLNLDRPHLSDSLLCPCNTTQVFDHTVCLGDSAFIGGKYYQPPAKDNLILTNHLGCDSLLFIDLKNGYANLVQKDTLICQGDTLWVDELPFSQPGQLERILVNSSGCDSLVQLEIKVAETYFTLDTAHLCDRDTLRVGTQRITSPGQYPILLKSIHGCDSLINLEVIRSDPDKDTLVLPKMQVLYGQNLTLQSCHSGTQYLWSPTSGLSCSNCPFPQTVVKEDMTYTVKVWTATCPLYCRMDLQVVQEEQVLFIPNIFSPNGDGVNDHFLPISRFIELQQLDIYDRSGALIYQEIKPSQGWDGRGAPEGVYVYVLRYQNGSNPSGEIKTGEITLVR